jgi:putative acetyltransferase
MTASETLSIMDARDEDGLGLIRLIEAVYAEYPNCILDVPGEEPDLLAIATTYSEWGGRFWVAKRGRTLVGCIGVRPAKDQTVELKKLYVASNERRSGLGTRLVDLVLDEGRKRGAQRIDLWSDTRFIEAHAFYERLGFTRTERTRHRHDISQTVEYEYVLPLRRDP